MTARASGLRTRLSTDFTSALGARPRVALMTGISRCQFETQTAAAACSAAGTSRNGMSWTEEGSFAQAIGRVSTTSISSCAATCHPEVDQGAFVAGTDTPRMLTEREDAGVCFEPNPLVEAGVVEGRTVRPSLGLKAVSSLAPRGRGSSSVHRIAVRRFLHESTPYA
jgi:hypothetical protein